MKIVLDLQACQASNRERGIGRYSLSLAQEMLRQAGKHDISIVLNNCFAETVSPLREAFAGLLPASKIQVVELPPNVRECNPPGAWRNRAAEHIRQRYLDTLAPDIVHVSSLFEGWVDDAVTSVSPGSPGTETAVTLYDLIPLLNPQNYLANPDLSRWYFRKLQSLKNADLLLAISEHSRVEAIAALQLPPDKVVNISTAVEGRFRPLGLAPQAFEPVCRQYGITRAFVMYTGGIDYRKNIDGLINAFSLLPPLLRSQYQLAIVCNISDAERHKLQSLASRLGLGPHDLVCTGFVDDDDLIQLYNCTTLFVFPSLHEGFGLPALEAMACGAAVIGSDRSSIPEVIGRQDALFDPARPQAIAAKIQQALTDSAYLATLRAHGLVQARQFSWKKSAQCALDAFAERHQRRPDRPLVLPVPGPSRPRLAYISPLPPEKTGIADYSAELLPELARYYDIDLVTDQTSLADPWLQANFPVRQVGWFKHHASRYDRIVYHFGNSAFHQHMFALLAEHPGMVVLHDFFLSGVLNYSHHTHYQPGIYQQSLYESHGYPALIDHRDGGNDAAVWKYPCNKPVLEQATGVIVHSEFSRLLAQTWYGPGAADSWQTIPLVRALPGESQRQAARLALGLKDTDFLVCAFGMLGPSKLNHELLHAWLASALADNSTCHLCFVGGNDANAYTDALRLLIKNSPGRQRITITGFATPETYRNHLGAADAAVQLRTRSRGETSASILDCLAFGLPTIINANGSATEIPDQLLLKLPDQFATPDLTRALEQLHGDAALRQSLAEQGARHVQAHHHPAQVGRLYHQAIEQFHAQGEAVAYRKMLHAMAGISTAQTPNESDLLAAATCTAANHPTLAAPQLLVDVSELVRRDAKSGIQRVVRNILRNLLESPPAPYRVEPVYDDGSGYRYARRFTLGSLGIPDCALQDTFIETRAGDIFLGLDLNPAGVPQRESELVRLSNRGVKIHFVVYDLLPVLRPDVFVAGAEEGFSAWLRTVTRVADSLVCISRAVAAELAHWVENEKKISRATPVRIGHFHLGADIAPPGPALDATVRAVLPDEARRHPTILMVGTLEPRKGQALALGAFERLWSEGVAINLVIVGKKGWKVDDLLARLNQHPQSGRHLYWLPDATDADLLQLYGSASALLSASEAEGFGLPLIEAAQHRLPLIVRDIPVFREVAGPHAFYFDAKTPEALAAVLQHWLDLNAAGKTPPSHALPWLSWQQSTQQLLSQIISPAATAS